MTLYENVWHTYELPNSYILDEFSRLQFDLQLSGAVDFIGVCLGTNMPSLHDEVKVAVERLPLCIHLFGKDKGWGNAVVPVIPFNLALGKSSRQNSDFAGYKASNAVDGDLDSVTFTDLVMNPTLEVDLEGEYKIASIVLHKNEDSDYQLMDDLTNMNVMVFDAKNTKVFHSPLFTMTDAITVIDLPVNTKAVRVVVTLTDGVERILSLKEIEVHSDLERRLGRAPLVDIPIGALYNGVEVNYMTFVQGSQLELTSHIADMKFVYGSIPEVLLEVKS